MTDCWNILEMPPTRDVEEIHRVRRALIRKWHPDTVEDPERKNEYTARCAAINAAHDEAVRIAQTARRYTRPNYQPRDFQARAPEFGPIGFSSGLTVVFSPRIALYVVLYLLAFRFTLPLTFFLILFAMSALLALVLDYIVYRYVLRPILSLFSLERHWLIPWAILGVGNILAFSILFRVGNPLFQAGVILAIPLWRLRRWMKETPAPSASPG